MSTENQSPATELDGTSQIETDEATTNGTSGEEQVSETESNETGETALTAEETQEQLQQAEQKKLSRFQRQQQRYEDRLAEQAREIEFLRKMAVSGKSAVEAPTYEAVAENNEPRIEDYEGKPISEYIAARDRYLEERLAQQAEQRALRAIENVRKKEEMTSKISKFKAELPDWDDVMEMANEDPVIPSDTTVQFIIESDIGPKIAYALAKDPDEHERIKRLPPLKQVAELARLEDRLNNKAAPAVVTKKTTSAPAKLSDMKGKANLVNTDTAAAARSGYAAWRAARDAQRK